MIEVASTEMAKRFSRYRLAAQHEPVAVTHHRRVTEVLISKRAYDEYERLKGMATRALWAHEISDDMLAALQTARVDPRHDHLDVLADEPAA
jgi:PHD/YefM family antitoxin component YafN of YafNO toxin-antitoxin module